MPKLCLMFDEALNTAMRETSVQIASNSSYFKPTDVPLHVSLIGSLHVYEDAEVYAALAQPQPPVSGRFMQWEISPRPGNVGLLRALIAFDDDLMMQGLMSAMPKGKAWERFWVDLGAVEGIDESQHESFLAAVQQAFPMDGSTRFALNPPHLEYHNLKQLPTKQKIPPPPPTMSAKSQAKALARAQQRAIKEQKQAEKGFNPMSRLSKEERRAVAALQESGKTLKKIASRNAASRRAHAAAQRAVVVQRARLRGMVPHGGTAAASSSTS